MDFSLEYTKEQEEFASEVRAWLEVNLPDGLATPADPAKLSYEQWQKRRALGRRLGKKGWLGPTFPKEYGGGGLTMDHAIVIEKELAEYGISLPPYYDPGIRLAAPAVTVWGSDEQKERFLNPILKGEVVTWQLFTEPGAGSDLAGLKTKALRDGDEFVINGEKVFVGGLHDVDQFWLLACTDPEGSRHKNLGMFIVPADLPGVSITALDLIAAGGEAGVSPGFKNRVYLEDVRVSGACLIGPETDGWGVANSTLEIEHGGSGGLFTHRVADRFLTHCRTSPGMLKRLKNNPEIGDAAVKVYIDSQIERLFALRNYWIRHAKKQRTYEGNQYSLFRKRFGVRLAESMMNILGPYALTSDTQWGIEEGLFECHQRAGIITAPGGSSEIQRVRMARRIGIGRATKEQASATT